MARALEGVTREGRGALKPHAPLLHHLQLFCAVHVHVHVRVPVPVPYPSSPFSSCLAPSVSPHSLCEMKCAVRAETEVRAERGGDDSDDEDGGRGKKGRGGKGGGKGREVEADEDDDDGKKKKGGKREQQKEEVSSPWCLVFHLRKWVGKRSG